MGEFEIPVSILKRKKRLIRTFFLFVLLLILPAIAEQSGVNNSTDNASILAQKWFLTGNALYDNGEFAEALDCYNRTIESDPQNATAWNNKAAALIELGRFSESVMCCKKAIKIDFNFPEAWDQLAVASLRLPSSDQIEEDLDPVTYIKIAERLRSIKEFNKSVRINPQNISAWYGLGQILNELKMKNESIRCFNKANELLGINATSGPYESMQVVVPMGPYQLSFLIRTFDSNMVISNTTFSRSAGHGKIYHRENFTTYRFSMGLGALYIDITQCTDSAGYVPSNPDPYGEDEIPAKWDADFPTDITIDGHPGYWTIATKTRRPDIHIFTYSVDAYTFVTIRSTMDWAKDISLIIDTIHVTKGDKK